MGLKESRSLLYAQFDREAFYMPLHVWHVFSTNTQGNKWKEV
jgi:hypothetical protein